MRKNRILSALTAVILTASLGLTGCSSSETSSGASDSDSSGAASNNSSDTSADSTEWSVDNPVTVKLGILGGGDEDIWNPTKDTLAAEGINIEYVFFTDYTQINEALDSGEIDLNAFQHYQYLGTSIEQGGYDITSIGDTYISATNIYSDKYTDVSQIQEGESIAIANDEVNLGRALNVLQAAGLITVDSSAGLTPDQSDITSNPLNLEIIEVDASQTPSLLPDVAAAVINGDYAIDAELSPVNDSIFFDDPSFYTSNDYVNLIAARTEDADNPVYKRIVEVYQSDATIDVYNTTFEGTYIAAWLSGASSGNNSDSTDTGSADARPVVNYDITDRTDDPVTVKLGIMGASDEEVWDPIIAAFAEKGVTIEKVFFSDYTQPNAALDAGDVDLNSFQHYTYLNNEIATAGYDITAIGDTLITALNLYSKNISSLDEIKDGDIIAVPNDAVNEHRALSVLQAAGLITVDPDVDSATVNDIIDNPLNLEFYEVDASQTASLLPDVTAAIVNGGYAIDAGLKRDDAIFFDDPSYYTTNAYVNIIAARTEDADNELYQEIVKAYQSELTEWIYANTFQGTYIPAWK